MVVMVAMDLVTDLDMLILLLPLDIHLLDMVIHIMDVLFMAMVIDLVMDMAMAMATDMDMEILTTAIDTTMVMLITGIPDVMMEGTTDPLTKVTQDPVHALKIRALVRGEVKPNASNVPDGFHEQDDQMIILTAQDV